MSKTLDSLVTRIQSKERSESDVDGELIRRGPKVGFKHRDRKLEIVEAALSRAIENADRRGYTGFVSGKGGLFDDPVVKRIMKRRDKLLSR